MLIPKTVLRKAEKNKSKNLYKEKQIHFFNDYRTNRISQKDHLLLNFNEYKKIFSATKSNTKNLENSASFRKILENVVIFFPKNKTKTSADEMIAKIRKMSTEKAADFFVNLKIDSTSDYWYYYYILSNVVLKGKINKDKSINHWHFPDSYEIDKENINDEFYIKLKNRKFEKQIFKKFSICRNKTMVEIKNYMYKFKPKDNMEMKLYLNYKDISDPKVLKFTDFNINRDISFFYQGTEFYKQINKMPKGIIHHIHLTASFYSFSSSLSKIFGEMNSTSSNLTYNEYGLIYLHEEDKVKVNNFSSIPNPKIFIFQDFKKLIESNDEKMEKLFKDNFILKDGRCIVTTENNKNIPINSDMKGYFYWRFCVKSNSMIFSRRHDELMNLLKEKNFFPSNRLKTKLLKFGRMNFFLQIIGNVFDNLNERNIPQSYLNLMSSKEDLFSNTIWYKFESIFGLYESLFDNPTILSDLTDILGNVLKSQNVYGVEFRQKYDKNKGKYSKYSTLVESFKKYNLSLSFILPGRKTIVNNGLIQQVNEINNNKEEDVTGFDFVGYEDDPFSGARNFFSLYMLQNQEERNKNTTLFESFFDTLKRGKKLYLHAGETLYFPNYPINDDFIDKFYINDNLIHSALLRNVERVGHGFVVANNGLLTTIFKKKNIGLEICPISNQLLLYNTVRTSPVLKLLKSGLKVSINPDDPGFFGYMGVNMDWFQLIMNHEDITPAEIYVLIKNSILKSSDNIRKNKDFLIKRLQNDLENFFKEFKCNLTEADKKTIKLNKEEIESRIAYIFNKKNDLRDKILMNLKKDILKKILVNIYDEKEILQKIRELRKIKSKKKSKDL